MSIGNTPPTNPMKTLFAVLALATLAACANTTAPKNDCTWTNGVLVCFP